MAELRRRAHGTGPRECARVPEGEQGHSREARKRFAEEDGDSSPGPKPGGGDGRGERQRARRGKNRGGGRAGAKGTAHAGENPPMKVAAAAATSDAKGKPAR